MFKLFVFIPVDSKEIVKEALFSAGAGQLGNYSKCSFEVLGKGQFQPNLKANPSLGSANELELVDEVKLEVLVPRKRLKATIAAMIEAHPYEEPAYEVLELFDTALLA